MGPADRGRTFNTGEFAWRVPLGVTDSLPPDKQKTGRPGNGGSIATAGGLVFIGATDDARFRAFDAKTRQGSCGRYKLGGAANATPSTYLGKDGRQYVVITATGGGVLRGAAGRRQHHGVRAARRQERQVGRDERRGLPPNPRYVPRITAQSALRTGQRADLDIAEPDFGAVRLKQDVAFPDLAEARVHLEFALGDPRLQIGAAHVELDDLSAVEIMLDVIAADEHAGLIPLADGAKDFRLRWRD